ncbi:MAG: EAL domain-containing protein, partial [Mariprofundaceae bacterium]
PMAEETGLITPMTWWVLDSASRQCALWRESGLEVCVSINLSAHNLEDVDVVKRVRDCLDKYELPPEAIVLEITESMLMDDPQKASEVLCTIADMNVEVSIDDFGTGYSSLAYLKHLQVSELKIDRSFVMGMRQNEHDIVIVRAIISLAHNLGLRVVAEGVENKEEWDLLADMNCDLIQGYLISRPQAVADITKWLRAFVSQL